MIHFADIKAKGHINLPNTDAVSWWWHQQLFRRGFNVITSHGYKGAAAKESCYSNAFIFPLFFSSISLYPQLPLSFPPSLMKRLMFDQSPPHGRPESIVDKRPELLFKRGLASVVQRAQRSHFPAKEKKSQSVFVSRRLKRTLADPHALSFRRERADNAAEGAGT